MSGAALRASCLIVQDLNIKNYPLVKMKSIRLIALLAVGLALSSSLSRAEDAKPAGTPGKCCAKAEKNGETCKHECCVEAAKEHKNCEKCGGTNEVKK